jgi:type II secretory pathway pseudopilin PulG
MNNRGLTLLEVLVIIIVIAILAALLLPISHGHPHKDLRCLSNLQQLYKVATVYVTTHRGDWPKATGAELWLSFRTMTPPLIEADQAGILHCDVLDHELGTEETNYRGPRVPFKEVPANGPLAADAEGNHGEQFGGNVLLVLNASAGDALWKKCRDALSP